MAHVLLIDDDPMVRDALGSMLRTAHHTVAEAENGMLGLDLFVKEPFDLVVTDIVMRHGEGLEAIMNMKRHSPDTPIIAISGVNSKKELLEIATEAGADLVLEKPIPIDILLDAVAHCLPA